jgi:hypothetical protein
MALKKSKTEMVGAKLAKRSCLTGFWRFHQRRHQDMGFIAIKALDTFWDIIPLSLGESPSIKFHNTK